VGGGGGGGRITEWFVCGAQLHVVWCPPNPALASQLNSASPPCCWIHLCVVSSVKPTASQCPWPLPLLPPHPVTGPPLPPSLLTYVWPAPWARPGGLQGVPYWPGTPGAARQGGSPGTPQHRWLCVLGASRRPSLPGTCPPVPHSVTHPPAHRPRPPSHLCVASSLGQAASASGRTLLAR
jgi:hypothetical protein